MKKNKLALIRTYIFQELWGYILCALVPMALLVLAVWTGWNGHTELIQPCMLLCIFLFFGWTVFKAYTRGFQTEDLIMLVLALGLIMRTGCMLYTPYSVRGHDVGWIGEDATGHAQYIWRIFQDHSLPDTNLGEFYQPPLFYLLSQLPVRIMAAGFPYAANEVLLEGAKVVSCFASCAGLLLVKRLCGELSLSKRTSLTVLAVAALHPNFFLLAGRVNNDSLLIFFQELILLYTVKWYKDQSVGNTVVLALAYGLGMMTKISCGTMAVFTGPVMLFVWIKSKKTPDFRKILRKGVLFLVVCAPLALWYPVRNLILFQQPLNYIPRMSTEHDLYCGGYSVIERFLSFPVTHVFDRIYCAPYEDYNVWLYLAKCSVFGEFTYTVAEIVPKLLVLTNILLILISVAGALFVMIKGKKMSPMPRFGLPFLWLTQLVFYLVFQFQYPFGCTMDFRYIVITAVIGAVMLGAALDLLRSLKESVYRRAYIPVTALVSLFGALSMVMYCSIS